MPGRSVHAALDDELRALETLLRDLDLWHRETPSAEALASTAPFACDRLLFTEWLQFLFIPRLRALLVAGAPLPDRSDITPMAEEYFKANAMAPGELLAILRRIDRLLGGA